MPEVCCRVCEDHAGRDGLLKQWDTLNEYCRNGWVEIDNNLCENALRVVALGRLTTCSSTLMVVATVQQSCTT